MSRDRDLYSTPALRVAAKLAAELPSRTHTLDMGRAERRGGDTSGLRRGPRKPVKRVLTGRGRGGANAKRVLCDGVEYPNIRVACKGLGIGFFKFYNWIETGRARYVVPTPAEPAQAEG